VSRLTRILVLNYPVVCLTRWENDVLQSDEDDLVSDVRPSDIEYTSSFEKEVKCDCQRVGNCNKR
jgi:hypothetical protein